MSEHLPYQNFTEPEVWKAARKLKLKVYEARHLFPKDEEYRLKDQLLRAVRSVCANIAEGHGRYTFKDQTHFCIQARGSLSEILNHLIDAYDLNIINEEILISFKQEINIVHKLLNAYIKYLRTKSV